MRSVSKRQIVRRAERKRHPAVIESIQLAKKHNQLALAKKLSGPTRQYTRINVDELNDIEGDSVIVVGSVLGYGEITRKMQVTAMRFSDQAREKLEGAGCTVRLLQEVLRKGAAEGNVL